MRQNAGDSKACDRNFVADPAGSVDRLTVNRLRAVGLSGRVLKQSTLII